MQGAITAERMSTMKVTTTPASRFGWPGQTLEYTIRAEGASQLSMPQECDKGISARVLETKSGADGLEARIAVDVTEGALY